MLLHPVQLCEEMKHQPTWNNRAFLAHHFKRKGLFHKVKCFPYVMYMARQVDDESPTWSLGHVGAVPPQVGGVSGFYEPEVGHYVRYKREFRTASAYATIVRRRADWENGAWVQFDPNSITPRQLSLPRRLTNACERAYYEELRKVVSALTRPGRVGRFLRLSGSLAQR